MDRIKDKFGEFRLALLPIGHYEPRWMMETHHMSPDDAVKLHKHMNVRQSVGIHFGTFGGHNDEEVDAHEKDVEVALKRYGVSGDEFRVLGFGEGRDVPKEPGSFRWEEKRGGHHPRVIGDILEYRMSSKNLILERCRNGG